jgi:tetratricopeptide (TPR) repeat protein
LAHSLNNLGILALDAGDPERAIAYLEETLAIDRELGNPAGIADSLGNLAGIFAGTGDVVRAAAHDAEALELRRTLGDRLSIAHNLASIAATTSRAGFTDVGARLFGAAERLREELLVPIPRSEQARYESGVNIARSALSADEFAQAWAAGRSLGLDDAIAEAMGVAGQIAGLGKPST